MELRDVRIGNFVKEHEFSSRGRALEPFYRIELSDLSYPQFMVGIPIDLEWCKLLGMDIEEKTRWATSSNFDWGADAPGILIRSFNGVVTVFNCMAGAKTMLEHVKYVHQLQNLYYGLWGFEIDEKNPTEFYKIKENE
jgi:hypothetical protein